MPDFQHILVATDFGGSSLRALHLAAELAARLTARLTLLYVVPSTAAVHPDEEPLPATPGLSGLGDRDPGHTSERSGRRQLDAFLESLADSGLLWESVIRFGEPSREIVAYAEESACDLIVVGTHGRGTLSRWLLGSVAEKVVRTSSVPVLTARADDERDQRVAAP